MKLPSRTLRVLVPVVAAALLLAGCGEDAKKLSSSSASVALPTQSVSAPPGITFTKPGSTLGFGRGATVGFVANANRSTALRMTVTQVRQGRISDLEAYTLDAKAKASRPYYATVRVKNVGRGQVGRSAIPLWGLSADDTLIGASGFTGIFARCPSGPLPAAFGAGQTTTTCLMFLVPQRGRLVGLSYRPVMADEPIVWQGRISRPGARR